MIVKFIAHAGISIEEDGCNLLLDPWFRDSDPDNPVIESIGGGFKTIDFQIPKTNESISNYAPDGILVSHFHPHHSSKRDIQELFANGMRQNKEMTFLYPRPNDEMESNLTINVPKEVTRREMLPGEKVSIGPFTIEAKNHTGPYHIGWLISSSSGSVLHFADGRLNRDNSVRSPDSAWEELKGAAPSLFLTSTGGHSVRRTESDGKRTVRDAVTLNSVEAAQITSLIEPKAVALMGMYNHSVWKNRHEYILATPVAEEQFQWAVSWLAPNIKNIRLIPGYIIHIGKANAEIICDTHIDG